MKTLKIILAFLTFSLVAISCNKDDEGTKAAPSVSEIKFTEDKEITKIKLEDFEELKDSKKVDSIYFIIKIT